MCLDEEGAETKEVYPGYWSIRFGTIHCQDGNLKTE